MYLCQHFGWKVNVRERGDNSRENSKTGKIGQRMFGSGSLNAKTVGEDYFSWICATWSKFLTPSGPLPRGFCSSLKRWGVGGEAFCSILVAVQAPDFF